MLIKRKKLITFFAVLIFIISSLLVNKISLNAASGEVSLVSSSNSLKVGDEFDIAVNVKDIQDIHAASFELNFDSSLMQIEGVLPGTLYNGLIQDKDFCFFNNTSDVLKGKISAAIVLTGISNGLSNQGSIFTLKAKALKDGTVTLKQNSNYIIKLANSSKTKDNKITAFAQKDASFNISKVGDTVVKEKLEQTDPRIAYSGTWYNHFEPRNSGSSAKYTNDSKGSFSFSFNGTGFRWYGLANKFKGKAKITIDGNSQIIDTYSDTEQYQKLFYENKSLVSGNHNVKIEVSTQYISIDYLEILTIGDTNSTTTNSNNTSTNQPQSNTPTVSAPASTTTKIEQTDSSIKYYGQWQDHWDNRNSSGSAKFTNATDAYIQFTFNGTGFKWYGLANKFKGKAKITIDGNTEIVDTYSANEQYQKLFYSKDGLASGNHTVKIATYTNYINIDYLEIIQQSSSTQQTPTLTGQWTKFEEDNSSIKYSATWFIHNNSNNSGSTAKFTNSQNASASFTFTGTGIRWYGLANKYKGPAIVTIDGKSENVNTYLNGEQYQKLFYEKKGLNYGTHTVKITLVYNYINIDKIEIENGKLN